MSLQDVNTQILKFDGLYNSNNTNRYRENNNNFNITTTIQYFHQSFFRLINSSMMGGVGHARTGNIINRLVGNRSEKDKTWNNRRSCVRNTKTDLGVIV
jgi:hypothetical protein